MSVIVNCVTQSLNHLIALNLNLYRCVCTSESVVIVVNLVILVILVIVVIVVIDYTRDATYMQMGHFGRFLLFWGYRKWHFGCPNQNSETTFQYKYPP